MEQTQKLSQTQIIQELQQLGVPLKTIDNWISTKRLMYNYHQKTGTVQQSTAYLYLLSVAKSDYFKWRSIALNKKRMPAHFGYLSMQEVEMELDNLELFRAEFAKFLQRKVMETEDYKTAAFNMYVGECNPISYASFPKYNTNRNRWHTNRMDREEMELEKIHLQKIYDFLFESQSRKDWLESLK